MVKSKLHRVKLKHQASSFRKLWRRKPAGSDNVEPGATLARGQGSTRDEAEKKALDKAKELVAKTRVVA